MTPKMVSENVHSNFNNQFHEFKTNLQRKSKNKKNYK